MQKTFQGKIVLRMFDGNKKELEKFVDEYNASRMRQSAHVITPVDRKIAADWKKGMTNAELARKYKMTQTLVQSRVRSVALDSLRNS